MNTHNRTARIVGALFLIAMVASLVGGIWLESFLSAPDYLSSISGNKTQVVTGVLLELINGFAVIGIAVALVLTWNLLEFFGIRINAGIVLALPMILNEIFLGIWLLVKGFDQSAITSLSDQHNQKV